MHADVIERVAKFFYLSCLDENLTFTASTKVLAELRAKDWLGDANRAKWVAALAKWKPRLMSLSEKPWTSAEGQRGFALPHGLDMGGWMTFVASTDPSEVDAVVFSRILGFTDDEIAEGLNVTVGTIRYRVGHGLRRLGAYLDA